MTNEEFEKTKEFIIQQQARFAVDIEKLKERQEKISADIDKLKETTKVIAEATLANTAMIGKLAEAQKISEEKIAKLSDKVDTLSDKMAELSDKMAETTDRLSSLIVVVEKHIEDHNGKSRTRRRKRSDQ